MERKREKSFVCGRLLFVPNALHAGLVIYASPVYNLAGQKIHIASPQCVMTYELDSRSCCGAMYVSYAFIVAEQVTLAVGTSILTSAENPRAYIVALLSVVGLVAPFNLRDSRVSYCAGSRQN